MNKGALRGLATTAVLSTALFFQQTATADEPATQPKPTNENTTPAEQETPVFLKRLKLEWTDGDTKYQALLALDAKAIYNINASSSHIGKEDWDLFTTLRRRGAVLHDAHGQAAWTKSDLNGNILVEEYHQNNEIHNPEPNKSAVLRYDRDTLNLTQIEHRQNGKLQNPPSGKAALQGFDPETGKPTLSEYYEDGKLQDPAENIPAIQERNGKTGYLLSASSYNDGKFQDFLSYEELVKLATEQGYGTPSSTELSNDFLEKFEIK